VLALAGRRIDAAGAEEVRFPLENVASVRRRLLALMSAHGARALVCSAAAGADLLALDAALELGLRARIVLPFDRVRFRDASVTDRPGDFGRLFDRIIDAVQARGDLVVMEGASTDAASYRAANEAILDEAARLARPAVPIAVVAWDGRPRGSEDATAAFASAARGYGWSVLEVLTRRRAPPAFRTR
jgi:hypothetical protein